MKYYIINETDDLSVIGNYPQTNLNENFIYDSDKSFINVLYNEIFSGIPEIKVDITLGAKKTNFLDKASLPFGILIDLKFKNILDNVRLPMKHKYYPLNVGFKGDEIEYYWVHYILDLDRYLNKDNSFVNICDYDFNVIKSVPLSMIKDMKMFENSLSTEYTLLIGELHFKSVIKNYDIFDIPLLGVRTIISDRLKQLLEKNNITGYELTPFDEMKING